MGVFSGITDFFIGRRVELPGEILRRHPELARARYRRGGLPTRVAGWALGQRSVAAVTLRRTVFLEAATALDVPLLLHELRHVEQFFESRTFPIRYLWESLRHGYHMNRYEVDARRFSSAQLADRRAPTPDKEV